MPESITAENLMNNIMETISEGIHKQNSGSLFEEEISNPVASKFNRLFGREQPVHKVLGGGKCKLCLVSSSMFWFLYLSL